jgi:hypothetical protein
VANPIGGSIAEVGLEIVSAAADGLGVHAGDGGDEVESPVSESEGFESGHPASLLFIEARENHIEPAVVFGEGSNARAAVRARARVNGAVHTGISWGSDRIGHVHRMNTE